MHASIRTHGLKKGASCVFMCVCVCVDQKGGAVLRMLRMYTALAVAGGTAFTTPSIMSTFTAPTLGAASGTPYSGINITSLPLRRRLMDSEDELTDIADHTVTPERTRQLQQGTPRPAR
jgi:hypothetical protein